MPNISLAAIWDETRAYIAREAALLLPVTAGTIGVAMVILFLAVPEQTPGAPPLQPGAWALWLIPYFLLLMAGTLALSALAIKPGLSVREALLLAVRRLPQGVALIGLLALAALLLVFFIGRVAMIMARLSGADAAQGASMGIALSVGVMMVLSVRCIFALPAIAAGAGPVGALAASWRVSAPYKWRLLLLWIAIGFVSLLLLVTVEFGVGSLILLLTRALGDPSLGTLLVQLVLALVSCLIQLVWLSFIARLYLGLSRSARGPSSKGT